MSSPPTAERPTGVRHWVVVFAAALAVITYMDRVSISFAAPSIRHDLGLTEVQMGWVFTAFGWAYAIFEIPGGFLGDWLGPRRVLLRIVLWWSCFTAATGWAWSFTSLVATRFLFGSGEAGCFPNLTKAFTTWLPEPERVRAQGILWFSARWGGALTPLLVAVIMRAIGWRHSFEIFGLVGIVWALLFFFWYRDNPLENPKLNAAERELLKHTSTLAKGHGDVPWRRLARSRQVWMLCGQYFCMNYGWYFYVTWLPSYLREARHVTITNAALLSVLPLLCGGVGNPVSVMLSRLIVRKTGNVALSRRLVAYLGLAGASAFLAISTAAHDPLFAMLSMGMASFSNDLVMPGAWATVMDVGGKYAGTLSGIMNMTGQVGGALSPLAIGYMLSWTHNWNLTFYISAAAYSTGILFWALLDPVTPLDTAPAGSA